MKKNDIMADILKKAKDSTSNKSYDEVDQQEEKEPTANKKEVGSAGRKKVKARQKKKARQVFYSDEEFEEIAECAEFLCIEPKTFMEMGIKKLIKNTQDEMNCKE